MRAAHGVLCSRRALLPGAPRPVGWQLLLSRSHWTPARGLTDSTGILRGPECPERKRHRASRCSGGVSMGGWPLRVSLASAQGSCPAVVPSS